MLADGYEALDGARRYVIRLRKGVRFHNEKEMTSADVVASLTRWGAMASAGKALFKTVEAVEARDPATLEIRLKEPSAFLPTIPAQLGSFAVIVGADGSPLRAITILETERAGRRLGPLPGACLAAGHRLSLARGRSEHNPHPSRRGGSGHPWLR